MHNYELIDAGGQYKLERFGKYIFKRPDLMAYFKDGGAEAWKSCDAIFHEEKGQKGHWEFKSDLPKQFEIQFEGVKFLLQITEYKHLGIFPEQRMNWRKIAEKVKSKAPFKVLNLFAYTGGASIIAAQNGAEVTHVDSSKSTMDWAKKNGELNEISGIRWICDDALEFVKKEVRRGNQYDLIIMDPPAFGMSKKKKKWQLAQMLPQLIQDAGELMVPGGSILLNTYSPKVDQTDLKNLFQQNSKIQEFDIHPLKEKTKTGKVFERGWVSWLTY